MSTFPELHSLVKAYPELHVLARRFESVSDSAPIDTDFVQELAYSYLEPAKSAAVQFERFSVPVLTDYLRRSHADYLDRVLPEISARIAVLCEHYEDPAIEKALLPLFRRFSEDLKAHIALEEEIYFPYAVELDSGCAQDRGPMGKTAGSNYSTEAFEAHHPDHDREIDMLDRLLEKLEIRYSGDMAFRTLRRKIGSFKRDLHLHCLIEDEVLTAKLKTAEKRLNRG